MFSDQSCSCSDEDRMHSLPVGSERRRTGCCGPPSLPARGHGVRGGGREEGHGVRGGGREGSSGCCSASPVPSHYKSPKDVDGDYSYAYR